MGGAGGTREGGNDRGCRPARGSRRSVPVAPALLQVSRRGVRSPRTVFRKGGLPGREWVETDGGGC